jgi:hypothetical protein
VGRYWDADVSYKKEHLEGNSSVLSHKMIVIGIKGRARISKDMSPNDFFSPPRYRQHC